MNEAVENAGDKEHQKKLAEARAFQKYFGEEQVPLTGMFADPATSR